jgi:hypothetical protein
MLQSLALSTHKPQLAGVDVGMCFLGRGWGQGATTKGEAAAGCRGQNEVPGRSCWGIFTSS